MTRATLLMFLLPLGGCRTVVIPPANPVDPAPVFIADYGRHSSLVLPRSDGRLVEYSYGQFAWYALDCAVPSVALSADYDVRPPASPVVEPALPDYRP